MKGRNTAEKHNKYLQDLYNNLSDENNTLKLTLSSKIHENTENKKLLTDFININEKLKKELLELDKRVKIDEMCMQCVEFEAVKERLGHLDVVFEEIKREKHNIEDLIIDKQNCIIQLQETVNNFCFCTKIFSN